MSIEPASLDALKALCLGFAFAGLLANGFEALAGRPASFRLLQTGGMGALASVPVLVFCAPFLIVRNTVRGRRIERRPVIAVVAATAIAGFWSLLSGRLVLDAALFVTGA